MLKSSELNSLISSSENARRLKEAIQNGVKEFRRGLAEKGRILSICLQDEGHSIILTKLILLKLCDWYLKDEIDEVELEYVASAFELSEDFEYEKIIANELFLLATPDINGAIDKKLVQEIITRLQNTA